MSRDMMITDYRDVPRQLQNTCMEWYDGGDSAMYNFWFGRPANAEKLLKEARRDVAACDPDGKWLPRLQALEAFALNHVNKVKAVRKLKAAIRECAMLGAEIYQVDDWRRAAEREVREIREKQAAEAAEEGEPASPAPGRF